MATPSIVHVVGDDWVIPIRWTAGDPAEPVDLTGYVIEGALYHAFVADPIILAGSIADQTVPETVGRFAFAVPAATTATFRPDPLGTYGTSLSITMIDPGGRRRTYAKLPIRADARRFAETFSGYIPETPPAAITVPGSIAFGSTTLTVVADAEVEILTIAEQGPAGGGRDDGLGAISAEQGAVLVRSSSGWVGLPHGEPAQILTSGGAGANVSWSTPPQRTVDTSAPSGIPLDGDEWIVVDP